MNRGGRQQRDTPLFVLHGPVFSLSVTRSEPGRDPHGRGRDSRPKGQDPLDTTEVSNKEPEGRELERNLWSLDDKGTEDEIKRLKIRCRRKNYFMKTI